MTKLFPTVLMILDICAAELSAVEEERDALKAKVEMMEETK